MFRSPRLLLAFGLFAFAAPLQAQEAAAPLEAAEEAAPAEAAQTEAAPTETEAEAVAEEAPLEATEESLALAERYLTLPAIKRMNDQLYGGNVLDSMLGMQTDLPEEVKATMARILKEEFARIRPDLDAVMIRTAAETFTIPELEAMIAFYETPEGESVAAKTAPFATKTFENFSEGLAEFQQTVVKRLMEELK